jgi:hypothetical protein
MRIAMARIVERKPLTERRTSGNIRRKNGTNPLGPFCDMDCDATNS